MGNFVFPVLYRIYLTGVGRSRHFSQITDVRRTNVHPHSSYSQADGAPVYNLGEDIRIYPVPFLEYNLAYIVLDTKTGAFILVDPADLEAVNEVMQEYGITGEPEVILTTHKHWDHAGHN